jgi:hypothetical protein
VSHLVCSCCGIADQNVVENWRAVADSDDAPAYLCIDRAACQDRRDARDGLPPRMVVCATCGAVIPRPESVRGYVHVGGYGEREVRFCKAGTGHRADERQAVMA